MNYQVKIGTMVLLWILWIIPFARNRSRGQGEVVKSDPRAKLGIVFTALAFGVANIHAPVVWTAQVELWRWLLAICVGGGAVALAWTSIGELGRQWHFGASLIADHQLVQTGAYRLVRHPIYLSIFCMLCTFLLLAGTLPGWPIAIVLGLIGTEIRVRVEDGLLGERFGARFTEWQKRVPAYLPLIR